MSQTPGKQLANRSFGLIFAVIFLLIGLFPLLFGGSVRAWLLYIAAGFTAIALLYPRALSPFNRAWAKFGLFMHKIVNPLLMGLVFFLTVLPTGLIMRMLGNDPMRRKLEPGAESYWIPRQDGITDEFFDNQF